MKFLKSGVVALGLLGAAGAGAALAPTAHGQSRAKVVEPFDLRVFTTGGTRIGVSVSDLEASTDGTTGVRIESVEADSPAAKAGLQQGDVVVEFDGERVRSVRQFSRLVSETPSGRQVAAGLTRDGKRMTVNITPEDSSRAARVFSDDAWRAVEEAREMARLAPRPVPPRPPSAPRPPEFNLEPFVFFGGNQLGVTVNSLPDQLKEYFGVKDGVLVTSVTDDSAAAKAGVKAGDVIVSLNGSRIESPSELRQEMADVEPGAEFTLEIMRDKKPMTLKGKAEERRSRRSTTRTIL
jgi:C-terminal processing protease CtpA/Prc